MAEFPNVGAHCAVSDCRILDFLPMKCDACSRILCRNHISYQSHSCPTAHAKSVQVPLCPLCGAPVPVPRHQLPDYIIGEHIDRDCRSDPAQRIRRKALQCSLLRCRRRELVPLNCADCQRHFCLNHRYPAEHFCNKKRVNPKLRPLPSIADRMQDSPDTESDEALARALSGSLNFAASDLEEKSKALAERLQREEYRRAAGVVNPGNATTQSTQNDRCEVS